MKFIGLTGGIGSGKSTVATILTHLGVPVYSSDDRAKFLVENNPTLQQNIINLLGNDAYDAQGHYNRAWVAAQVFNDETLLIELNKRIHPIVQQDFLDWVAKQTCKVVAKEAALIQSRVGFDALWVVTAPVDIRIQRIQQRDPHRSIAQIEAIMAKQPSEAQFRELATHILDNHPRRVLVPQILAALTE